MKRRIIPGGVMLLTLHSFSQASEAIVASGELNAKVLPNPAKDVLSIEIEQAQDESSQFELYSASGQLVFKEMIIGNTGQQINVSRLASGLYFYRIVGEGDKIKEGKLIINEP